MASKDPPKVADLTPGTKVSGYVHSCERCEVLFIARLGARFCSNACRVAASRAGG